nr:MAG TPA: hypothetical protein [Caudoviricetes sp.]
MGAVFFLAISYVLHSNYLAKQRQRYNMLHPRFMASLWSFAHLTYKASKGKATR